MNRSIVLVLGLMMAACAQAGNEPLGSGGGSPSSSSSSGTSGSAGSGGSGGGVGVGGGPAGSGGSGGQGGEAVTTTGVGGAAGEGGSGGAGGAGGAPPVRGVQELIYVGSGYVAHLVCDGTSLFWADAADTRIVRANLDGTGVTSLITAVSPRTKMFSTGSTLTFATSGAPTSIVRLPKTGGSTSAVTAAPGISHLAVDDSGATFWSFDSTINSASGAISVSGATVTSLYADSGEVFWTSRIGVVRKINADGTLMRTIGSASNANGVARQGSNTVVSGTDGLTVIPDSGVGQSTVPGSATHVAPSPFGATWVVVSTPSPWFTVRVTDVTTMVTEDVGSSLRIAGSLYCAGYFYWWTDTGEIWRRRWT